MNELDIENRPAGDVGSNAIVDWLKRGSIVDQMGRVFNLFAIGFLILSAGAIAGTLRVDYKVETFAKLSYAYIETADSKVDIAKTVNALKLAAIRRGDTEDLEGAVRELRRASERLEQIRQLGNANASAELEPLATISEELRQVETRLSATSGIGMQPREDELLSMANRLQALSDQIVEVRDAVDLKLIQLSGEGIAEVQRLVVLMLVIGSVAVGLVFIGKRLIRRQIASPIARISDASERIANGETDLEIPGGRRKDEIGKLANALSVLRNVQIETIAQAQREVEREKELQDEREKQEAERAEQRHALAIQFEQTIGEVANEVASASDQLKEAALSLVETVDASSSGVESANGLLAEASRGMTGAAAATDEFALSITEVSSQAKTSSERANKAADAAASADQTIGAMTDSADKISRIVEVIATIAQRTNLLALNASIEAARSADAGRGFAVVANEVKELALQTRRETEQVEMLITSMQNATGLSASALSTIAQEVIELEVSAGAIASAVDQQANAGQDLAKAIDMAARNTSEASESFAKANEVTAASTHTANQLRDSSETLSAQSDRLRDQVAKFLDEMRAA